MNGKNFTYIQAENDAVNIYMHSPKGRADNFMKYTLRHFIVPFSDGRTYQNQNVWRLFELYSYKKTDDGLTQELNYQIVNGGEWECAIKIKDTPDFHGGYHGYENTLSALFMADGEEIDLSMPCSKQTEKFECILKSEIYRQGTENEIVAEHIKHYVFENGKVLLHQEILWKQTVTVLYSYLMMFPIRRTSDDTPSGEVISDRISINDNCKVYDIEKAGHETEVSNNSATARNVEYAKIWGRKSGICAEISINCKLLPTNSFFVQNNNVYNKLYFSYVGDGVGHKVNTNEKWTIDTIYEIYRNDGEE